MRILGKDFEKLLLERGKDYINTFKEFKSELKKQDFFNEYGEDNFGIESIEIILNSNNSFETERSDIILKYFIDYPSYCYRGETERDEYKLILPSFIFTEEKHYLYTKERLLKEYKNQKWEKEQNDKIKKRKKLKELAKELGYEIKRIEK